MINSSSRHCLCFNFFRFEFLLFLPSVSLEFLLQCLFVCLFYAFPLYTNLFSGFLFLYLQRTVEGRVIPNAFEDIMKVVAEARDLKNVVNILKSFLDDGRSPTFPFLCNLLLVSDFFFCFQHEGFSFSFCFSSFHLLYI